MINLNDIMGGNQQEVVNVPVEKLDLFIDRCKNERGYNLPILGNEIQVYISQGMFKLGEVEVYQMILQRVKERYDSGER